MGNIDWKTEAPQLNEYLPDDRTRFPKYIYYSAHNDNLSALLRAIDEDKYKFETAGPGAGVQIEWSFLPGGRGSRDTGLKVNLYLSKCGYEFDSREPLLIPGVDATEDGRMAAEDFKNWVEAKLAHWDDVLLKNKPLRDRCEDDFEYNPDEFADPWPFFENVYDKFNVIPRQAGVGY